jgi:hypothetical protein
MTRAFYFITGGGNMDSKKFESQMRELLPGADADRQPEPNGLFEKYAQMR